VTSPPTVLLSAAEAATYAGVLPATLRVWRLRYGLTRHYRGRASLYDLAELAAVLERRASAGACP
jgi:hypothetical protein